MNYGEIHTHINSSEYDAIVSIGNKCPTALILRDLGIYRESFPFDYVPTTPALILKYLKSPYEFYPGKGQQYTADGLWFGHFDLHSKYDLTVEAFKRRFDRLFQKLEGKKKILFVYTSEADIYNEMNNRYNDNYADLLRLRRWLIETYQSTDFLVLAIHTNKFFPNEENMVNYTITVDPKYLSDNKETNIPEVFEPYRNVLKSLLSKIFLGSL
jgi:hypothetical protein